MLQDPFGKSDPAERTVWYQSRFYRANLHMRGGNCYFRDLHVYDDRFEQPYLNDVVTEHGIEQRLLATLDGFHWSSPASELESIRAKGSFSVLTANGTAKPLRMSAMPTVKELSDTLTVSVPLESDRHLEVTFNPETMSMHLSGPNAGEGLRLVFEWDPTRTAFVRLSGSTMHYRFRGFEYEMCITAGAPTSTARGVRIDGAPGKALELTLIQPSAEA